MVRTEISLSRFKWKPAPWMVPENVLAIWLYCENGDLTYEFELKPNVQLPKMDSQHSKYSKNSNTTNFVRVSDAKILAILKSKMKSFDVSGAKGRGIIVGEILVPIGASQKKMLVMSTLRDWKDWMENKRNFP